MTINNSFLIELKPFLQEAWSKSSFETLTPVQEKSIPFMLAGQDVIAESPTGTGKTLAYLLPLLEKIDVNRKMTQAVILASSQELAMQILKELQNWATESGITNTSLIGGANPKRQLEKLKKSPQVVVGTPGRVLELIKQKKLKMHEVKTVVLDEGDQLLGLEHLRTIQEIVKSTKADRQVVLFSATLPAKIEQAARDLMKEPELIKISRQETLQGNVEHVYLLCEPREKIKLLEKIGRLNSVKGLVFAKDIGDISVMVSKLQYKDVKVAALHSELKKIERQNTLKSFREGKISLLVATDVAARGLDIQGITHVVHFDSARDETQYVHRSGRTGRFGADGTVISLVTDRELRELKQLTRQLNIQLQEKVFYQGQIRDKK